MVKNIFLEFIKLELFLLLIFSDSKIPDLEPDNINDNDEETSVVTGYYLGLLPRVAIVADLVFNPILVKILPLYS